MAKKWIKNKWANVTPVYECDTCGHFMKKVSKPTSKVDEVNTKPTVCKGCESLCLTYHASWVEFLRWCQLRLLLKNGHIKNLKRQVRMPVIINSIKVFTYIADFDYYTVQGKHVIEDVKDGIETQMFKLKRTCVYAYYGVQITIP